MRVRERVRVAAAAAACNRHDRSMLLCVAGIEVSQIDSEVEKTMRRLEELKELQRMRDSIARTKSFVMLSNDFVEDKQDESLDQSAKNAR